MPTKLESAVSRVFFRMLIPTYITQGFSANAMILAFRKIQPAYQRQIMLQDIRTFTGLFAGQKQQSLLKPDTMVPESMMGIYYHPSPAKYRVTLDVNITNRFTGAPDKISWSYYTNEELSPHEYAKVDTSFMEEESLPVGWNLGSVDFRVVQRAAK